MSYTNLPYPNEDQYQNKEWKFKRKKILTRDNFECQECHNRSVIQKSVKGRILKVAEYRTLLAALNMSDELFYKKAYRIDFLDDLGKEHSQNILSHLQIANFDALIGAEIYLCTIRDKTKGGGFLYDMVNQKVTDTIINCIKSPDSKSLVDKWFFVRNLHVHHKKYSDDGNMANIPDKDLITLCARCHQKKHSHRELAGFCD